MVLRAHADQKYANLKYISRRYVTRDAVRNAIRRVVNDIFKVRQTHIWGEGTPCRLISSVISFSPG